jgi:peptidyl-prolyl cis-trans isomerase SurA
MNRSLSTLWCAASLAALLMTAAPASAQQAGQPPAPTPVAQRGPIEGVAVLVNDEVITFSDVRNRTRLILLGFGGQPDEQAIAAAQQRAVDGLIEDKLKIQEFGKLAKDRNISDEEVNERLAAIARQNRATLEEFLSGLAAAGVSPQTLRSQTRADIAWNALIRGRFASQIRVSDLRISEMLERLKGSLNKSQYRIAEIFLYAPDLASRTTAKEGAETLKRQIEQGAPFEAVAQQFSAAPSASAGGDLGWLTPTDMRPEIQAVVESVTPPALAPPIETEGGVYLIAVLGKRAPADAGVAVLDLKQVSATGDDAATRLNAVKAAASTCAGVADAAAAQSGVEVNDLAGVALTDLNEQYRGALGELPQGGVSEVMDIGESKSVFYVCRRETGGAGVPTREEVRERLFDTEISMRADRYMRDLKRDATIIRR